MVESLSEIQLMEYKGKAGVYFIQCYNGVIKIGCSTDIYARLISYSGVYWKNQILKIWLCNSPLFLEQQLHLVLGIELKQIRKGKYELFQLQETDTQSLADIIQKVDQRAMEILRQMDEANYQNFDQEVSAQIQFQIDEMETQSQQTSIAENNSVLESDTSGMRVLCRFANCDKRTTKIYCFKHRPENAQYNHQRYQQRQLQQARVLDGYLETIDNLTAENASQKEQIAELQDIIKRQQERINIMENPTI